MKRYKHIALQHPENDVVVQRDEIFGTNNGGVKVVVAQF